MTPSVTQVLSPWSDFSRISEDVLARAAERGTQVHRICAAIALGLWVPNIPPECAGYVLSFQAWLTVVQDVIFCEERLHDPVYGFNGMPDMIVRIKGDSGHSLLDLKSPAAVAPTWRIQLAAYQRLAEANGYNISRVFSLRLDKNGGRAKVDEYTGTSANDLRVFLACLTAFKHFSNGGK